jgi:hypothetical protein
MDRISAMVFGHHILLTLILVILSSVVLLRSKFTPETLVGGSKRMDSKEFGNIPAEQLQRVNQNLFCQCGESLPGGGPAFSTPPVICELYLLHSKHYWPTGILSHWQNSYTPCSQRCTSCYEPVNKSKNLPVCVCVCIYIYIYIYM